MQQKIGGRGWLGKFIPPPSSTREESDRLANIYIESGIGKLLLAIFVAY
jgi:hypothetical protein